MHTFQVADLVAQLADNQAWLEFLKTSSLSLGIYRLKTGQADLQKPHAEDEVYYVLAGRASFESESKTQSVSSGTLLCVERNTAHRFVDVTEDLTVLVFFAPAEGSRAGGATP